MCAGFQEANIRRRKPVWTMLFLLGLACSFLAGCDGAAPYFAYVDRVEPAIAGLDVKGTRGIGGWISIVNDTGLDVYIYDEDGQEVLKITPVATFRRDVDGTWAPPYAGNAADYNSKVIQYWGPPDGRSRGQVMKTWVIEGRAGDTPFKVYGRTVYEPAE